MEYRLNVEGEPITEWERVKARDLGLWMRSIRANLNIAGSSAIEVESRKIPDGPMVVVEDLGTPSLQTLRKVELLAIADAQGIDAPKGSSKAQLIALIRGS